MWKVPESRRCEPISWKTPSLFLFLTFTCGVSTTLVANIGQSSLPLHHCPRHISIFGIIYKGLHLPKGEPQGRCERQAGRMSVANLPVRHECFPQKNQQSQPSFWYFILRWWWERTKSNSLGHQPEHFFNDQSHDHEERKYICLFVHTYNISNVYNNLYDTKLYKTQKKYTCTSCLSELLRFIIIQQNWNHWIITWYYMGFSISGFNPFKRNLSIPTMETPCVQPRVVGCGPHPLTWHKPHLNGLSNTFVWTHLRHGSMARTGKLNQPMGKLDPWNMIHHSHYGIRWSKDVHPEFASDFVSE